RHRSTRKWYPPHTGLPRHTQTPSGSTRRWTSPYKEPSFPLFLPCSPPESLPSSHSSPLSNRHPRRLPSIRLPSAPPSGRHSPHRILLPRMYSLYPCSDTDWKSAPLPHCTLLLHLSSFGYPAEDCIPFPTVLSALLPQLLPLCSGCFLFCLCSA